VRRIRSKSSIETYARYFSGTDLTGYYLFIIYVLNFSKMSMLITASYFIVVIPFDQFL